MGGGDWEVVNCSIGGIDWKRDIERVFAEAISEGDIIIFMSRDFDQWKIFEKILYKITLYGKYGRNMERDR